MQDLEILLEKTCGAPVSRLWEVLIMPASWWGSDVRLDPQPGGLFHEPWRDEAGPHHTRGKVLKCDAPHLISLSWRDDDWSFSTQVTLRLSECGVGSTLQLHHTGWEAAPASARNALLDGHLRGWAFHLENLVAQAGRGSAN